MQNFKNEAKDLKVVAALEPMFTYVDSWKDAFFEGAFTAYPLGDALWEADASPIIGTIPQDSFRAAFPQIYNAFQAGGTLESYILVFKKVFGDNVDIDFTIPNPGHLQIDISTDSVILLNLSGYEVLEGETIPFDFVDQDGDNIVVQTFPGITSQYGVELFLVEMTAAGVFVETTLTFGS